MIRTIQRNARTIVCHLLLAAPALAWAQEASEDEPPAPPDVAQTAGEWWVRLGSDEFQAQALSALINIAAIMIISAIVYFIALAVVGRAIERMEHQTDVADRRRRSRQRVVTVLELVRSVVRWVILITGGIWILASAGMDIRPVLAGAGVIGLAVGFGAQNLVRDIVSGFFVLLEGQYAVGDYVRIGTSFGMVESIGMRTTVLRDLNNQRHFVPNGTVALVTVYEQPYVSHIVEVPLADAADCEKAAGIVADLAERLLAEYSRYLVYTEPPATTLCDEGPRLRLPVAIFPTQDWLLTDEIPASITAALTAAEIPLPEGRTIRNYPDLRHMPEYRYAGATEEPA